MSQIVETKNNSADTTTAQDERIVLSDWIITGLLAAVAVGMNYLWRIPGIPPTAWADSAVASGVRPATHIVKGFWTLFAKWLYSFTDPSIMKILGTASLAFLVGAVYLTVREMLHFVMLARPQHSKKRIGVVRAAAAFAALTFLVSEPIWAAGQFFSETMVLLLMTVAAISLYFVFLRKGQMRYALLLSFVLGLLSAETVVGPLLLVATIAIYLAVVRRIPNMQSPLFKPAVMALGKWHMTAVYVFALVVGILLNCWGYVLCGGLEANGFSGGDLPLQYALNYWRDITAACTPGALALWFGVFLVPCVVSMLRFPPAADEEENLTYSVGVVFVVCGLLAFTQCCGISALWFWTYVPVPSDYFHAFGVVLNTVTVAMSLAVFGYDAFCRDHALNARHFIDDDDANSLDQLEGYSPKMIALNKFLVKFGLLALVLVALVPGRSKKLTREMARIVNETVAAMLDECEDAKYLVTDGRLDTAIEMESVRRGRPIYCLSLMGGGGTYGENLRTRGEIGADSEDKMSFSIDVAMGLRSWIRDKPMKLDDIAAQMGFDLWKRDGKAIPPMGGFVSRPAGWKSAEVRARGLAKAKELVERILAIYAAGGIKACSDRGVKDAFESVQWRLARMCRYRGDKLDLEGHAEEAIVDAEMATKLEDLHGQYQRLLASMVQRNMQMQQRITPREGLQLSLSRADFHSAKIYADVIIESHPEDVDSNFAEAMYYATTKNFARAEEYLTRCITLAPNQPAFYNNLAMVQIEMQKFKEAAVNVKLALSILPDNAAVLDTKKRLIAAKKKFDDAQKKEAEQRAKAKADAEDTARRAKEF